jgi:hypothetical protein
MPIHIAAVRSSAAYLKADLVGFVEGGTQMHGLTEAWVGPLQSATIEITIDTERFVGDKTANIYVKFDQPMDAEVQLQVHAKSVESPTGAAVKGEPEESKARILELELKVDHLKQQPAKPRSRLEPH